MTNQELIRFQTALREQRFNDYEIKIVKAILSGEGVYNQEDILRTSNEGIAILKKLGWYRRVKNAIKTAGLHLLENNQMII